MNIKNIIIFCFLSISSFIYADDNSIRILDRLAFDCEDNGNEKSCFDLGVKYLYTAKIKDLDKGIYFLEQAAQNNLLLAQLMLAKLYYQGNILPKNYNESLRWYRIAAVNNSIEALKQLGLFYAQGIIVPKNLKLVFKYYNKAAMLGDPESLYKVANMFKYGIGTKKDGIKALDYFELACSNQILEACSEIK